MKVELKPCPFCGGEASVKSKQITQGYEFYVSCDKCKARTGVNVSSDYGRLNIQSAKATVSMVWNYRVGGKE